MGKETEVDAGRSSRGKLQSSSFLLLILGSIILISPLNSGVKSEYVLHLEVSESILPGSTIGFIDVESPPYLIVPVPGSPVKTDLFVDSASGEIRTKVSLDRETNPSYSFVVLPQNIRVVIKVLDENDNVPTFSVEQVDVEFPENSPRDAKRALPPAKDADLGLYSTQRYEIVSGNYGDMFKLSQHRGRDGVLYLDLQNSGYLDREIRSSYYLVVEALDGGLPPLRSRLYVNVLIQDVNDNPPIFNQTRYTATVPENTTVGTPIITVKATDADIGENSQIEYSINRRQSDREEIFRIDPQTGIVYVNKALDFEYKERHELVVVAKDLGAQPLEASTFLSVYVRDVNDNQPTITVIFLSDDATPKISESAQPGEFIARISVSDPDSRTEYSNATVTLFGGDGRFGLATRDNIIYLVVVERPLDREEKPIYDLSVEATDAGTPPLRAIRKFSLLVTDINDNAPVFEREHYEAHLLESAEPGSPVLSVKATDADEGLNAVIKYSLKNSTWFSINEDTGLISSVTHVDCETDPTPLLLVIATDSGRPSLSGSATVKVTVHDLNDNEPIFEKPLYNVSVLEDLSVGRCFLQVHATDPDCGVNSMVNYTLSTGQLIANKQLFVRSDTGEICVRSSLDREIISYLELSVIATDRAGLSTAAVARVEVNDVNDNRPIFNPQNYNITIRSNISPSSTILKVAAKDLDSGLHGEILYRISSGNDGGIFRIDKITGELQVVRPNLLSRAIVHLLNITAADSDGLKSAADAHIIVSVSSTQHIPTCERPRYTISTKENILPNSIIGDIKEAIYDTSLNLTPDKHSRFFMATGEKEFSIDPILGTLRTKITFDREVEDKYILSVGIKNNLGIGYCQVELTVEDLNDNWPSFPSTNVKISVPESHPLHIPLYIARATDPDIIPPIPLRYVLNQNNNDIFSIEAQLGAVFLSRRLDYESQQRHSLIISALDGGGLSGNMSLDIEVQDINDNPPVFERKEYNIEVSEATKIDSQIIQVTALDLDTGNNARISYRLKNSTLFRISPNTGWIYSIQSLDRESVDHYTLAVLAIDNGSPATTTSCLVSITVLDENDNSPRFEKEFYAFELVENLPSGTLVGGVKAQDIDLGSNALIKYAIVQHNSSFTIDPDTGEIVTRETLDREIKSVYELVLEARDSGALPKTARVPLRVTILDINDNSPIIVDPQGDIVSVREEQLPGTEVAKVRALDTDSGENATITYSILKDLNSGSSSVFTIDPITGIIRTKIVLDHEEQDVYRVSVKAMDAGQPPRHSIRTWRVEVLALADNRPTFTSSSLTFHVREDASIGHLVGSILSSGSTGRLAYTLSSLTPSTRNPTFDIHRSSGQLVVAHLLDRENISEYSLKICALDTTSIGNPQSIAISAKIIIDDFNDNPPKWPIDPILIKVPENVVIGTIIYNLTAVDLDSGQNGDIRYELVSEFPLNGSFTVDSVTGALIVAKRLDREDRSEYILSLRASDRAPITERLSSTVTAKIIILDENDNDPVFIAPITTKLSVTSDLKPGTNLARVIAVDPDADKNGRVSYIITSGNEESRFSVGYDSGMVTVAKPIIGDTILQITANDHGTPPRKATMNLTLTLAIGQSSEVSRILKPLPIAGIPQDFIVGGVITNIATSNLNRPANITFHIPSGIANNRFNVSPTGIVTLQKPLNQTTVPHYYIPIIAESSNLFELTTLEVVIQSSHCPKFQTGSCYTLTVPENQESSIIHTFAAFNVNNRSNDVHYSIAAGNIGGKFKLDPTTGDLFASSLDREIVARYILTISAKNKLQPSLEDRCNITIIVLDANDNPPKFLRDQNINRQSTVSDPDYFNLNGQSYNQFSSSVYPKYNSGKYVVTISEDIPPDSSIVTVKATDPDQGINGKITYAIAEETTWLFRVDNFTGVITTAGSLDREVQIKYNFLVIATDGSKYDAKSTSIAIEINLNDVNDNAPIFDETPFIVTIPVTTQPGQSIIQIKANDLDDGINSEIIYSFAREQEKPKFRIHPNSGVVTTTSVLTQDYGKVYDLEILAKDKGNPSKSTTGLLQIRISHTDELIPVLKFQNDTYSVVVQENSPAGMEVVQVTAVRSDGRRQHVSYYIGSGNEYQTFHIDTDTGIVRINDQSKLDTELRNEFINSDENTEVINKNSKSGGELLNNEKHEEQSTYQKGSKRVLTLIAKTIGSEPVTAYAKLIVYITDVNDNAPIFTQTQYSATVLEGNNKGDFVLKLSASDIDQGINSKILYHIVDGNPDNAFTINPPYSGIVRTNIVLDREIKEKYRLTVIATDQGNPQLTGTAAVSIRVIDINDNQPTFPGHNVISVPEDTAVGTVLSTVTANDVDSSPPLMYRFGVSNRSIPFTIDRYGGKITLKQTLDAEKRHNYTFQVIASDGIHEAMTDVTVKVLDINDNAPKFTQAAYIVTLSETRKDVTEIVTVVATDDDLLEANKVVRYYLLHPVKGFNVQSETGVVTVNRTALAHPFPKKIELVIIAKDSGKPSLSSTSSVIVRLSGLTSTTNKELKINVNENTARGTSIFDLADMATSNGIIISQDDGNTFEIFQGNLIISKNLDRESKDRYILQLGTKSENTSDNLNNDLVIITIIVDDANDNYPHFTTDSLEISIKEDTPPGTVLATIEASDNDLAGTPASTIVYNISSGNDAGLFCIDNRNGIILVNSTLDCDVAPETYNIVILACDSDLLAPLCTLAHVYIYLEDVNDNAPKFPVSEYSEFVGENEPIGTEVFSARASDLDRGIFSTLNYSIVSAAASGFSDIDDSWKLFSIDAENGIVRTSIVFDYEQRNRYAFILKATDAGGRSAAVRVRVEIDSRDEFYPQFTERMYRFSIHHDAQMSPGTIVGQVTATDRDKGPDGRVVYQLTSLHPFFKLNRTTGMLIIKKQLNFDNMEKLSRLVVSASSGKQGSLSNMTVVEIRLLNNEANGFFASNNFDTSSNFKGNTAITTTNGLADWALGLLITLVLLIAIFGAIFLYLHFKNRKHKKPNMKPSLSSDNAATSNSYVDPSAFDTIPIRNVAGVIAANNGQNIGNNPSNNDGSCQFAPPKYDEIPPYGSAGQCLNQQATSEISGSDQSGSSGRGSAEDDGEDEEIRMINEGQTSRDSISDLSVHNTQEYLARLGIVDAPSNNPRRGLETLPLDSMHIFENEAVAEADIATFIYGKIGDSKKSALEVEVPGGPSMNGSLSSIVHSEEELTGSYNWDYLLDWGPQYQPLAHVFSEIARLKDDTTNIQGNNLNSNARHKTVHKAPPPPLLTSIAPRSVTIPVLSRGMLPRSPISHDASTFPAAALSPSFSPSLSPLATRSPSISPLVPPTPQRTQNSTRGLADVDNELRI